MMHKGILNDSKELNYLHNSDFLIIKYYYEVIFNYAAASFWGSCMQFNITCYMERLVEEMWFSHNSFDARGPKV